MQIVNQNALKSRKNSIILFQFHFLASGMDYPV